MPDLFAERDALISSVFAEACAKAVTYRRGALNVVLQATIDRTEFVLDDGSGVIDNIETRDFVFPAASLILGAVVVLPIEGDTIDEVIGAATFTRRVGAPKGQKIYEFDASRTSIRVRTRDRQ